VSELRRLVGLSPHISEEGEPFWDARLVNRLVHLNLGVAVAERCAIDVVEYEAGLSRIASEKWYSQFGFNRTFPSSDAFDRVLRSAGVPALGVLEATIGLEPLIAIAESNEGQAFRDWFWRRQPHWLAAERASIASSPSSERPWAGLMYRYSCRVRAVPVGDFGSVAAQSVEPRRRRFGVVDA
jgi:hypothetical protein